VSEDATLIGMISSTEIRRRVKEDFGILGLVTPSVDEFIHKEGLFK
jgi:nicotinic acid mononucleotide adenylyltransferase